MPNLFEMIQQTEIEWCWAATGATVKDYFTPDRITECGVARLFFDDLDCGLPVPDSANQPEKLQDVLGKLGNITNPNQVKANYHLTFPEIQAQITLGLPVCARIDWFGEARAHFVAVCGWGISASGDQWVDVADPFFGSSTILYDSFVNDYQDAGEWNDSFLVNP